MFKIFFFMKKEYFEIDSNDNIKIFWLHYLVFNFFGNIMVGAKIGSIDRLETHIFITLQSTTLSIHSSTWLEVISFKCFAHCTWLPYFDNIVHILLSQEQDDCYRWPGTEQYQAHKSTMLIQIWSVCHVFSWYIHMYIYIYIHIYIYYMNISYIWERQLGCDLNSYFVSSQVKYQNWYLF